ncbi:VirB8/TrbF family protein [Pseudoalteromonas galatheae]|uniref:VirB8/TrbF family protein n=1 Tax=Pseudoalteromonas galatheae TaxID=579562 RepID=UPI0030CF970E
MSIKKLFTKKQEQENTSVERRQSDKRQANPYTNYRRRWNDHTGSVSVQRNMWMILCLIAMLISAYAIQGLISVAGKSKFIPYVVEVDQLGNQVTVKQADSAELKMDRVLKAVVSEFISNARLVTPDVELQRKAIFNIYSKLAQGNPATPKMSEHLNGDTDKNPFKRAQTETVNVKILSVLQQTSSTFQVDWEETIRDRKGVLAEEPFRMKALVTVQIVPHTEDTTEEDFRANPLGIYIFDYNWSKTL